MRRSKPEASVERSWTASLLVLVRLRFLLRHGRSEIQTPRFGGLRTHGEPADAGERRLQLRARDPVVASRDHLFTPGAIEVLARVDQLEDAAQHGVVFELREPEDPLAPGNDDV